MLAVALFALLGASVPQPSVAGVDRAADVPPVAKRAAALAAPDLLDPAAAPVQRFRDADAKVEIAPPAGWRLAPQASLDRAGDDDLFEVARFQLRIGDPSLYAQPLAVTSGLLADAGAVISIGLAREGSGLLDIDLDLIERESRIVLPGAVAFDDETSYEGVTTFTRTIVARRTGRVVVVRAFVPSAERDALAAALLASIASARVEPEGPVGPAYVPPPPPPPAAAPAPAPAVAAAVPDPSASARAAIIERARAMLGTPYVWGGNVAGAGMDCSAYISRAWGVARYTTDSIGNVAVGITKDALLPGDALNLETWRDPTRRGHIRMFDAWANAERTLLWVYEETPPRALHRVIAYDPAYRPIRLAWLGGDGVAPLVPAPAAQPVPHYRTAPAPAATRRPAATPRPTPTPRPVVKPSTTVRPSATARPSASVRPSATARVSARPAATARTAAASASPARSAPTPRPTAQPKRR